MLYEFTQPFIVDSTKAEMRLGIRPTPIGEALASTVAWFRARDGNHGSQHDGPELPHSQWQSDSRCIHPGNDDRSRPWAAPEPRRDSSLPGQSIQRVQVCTVEDESTCGDDHQARGWRVRHRRYTGKPS